MADYDARVQAQLRHSGRWSTPVLAILLLGVALWPLRQALVTNAVPGAGPDVVSTFWGMWWFQQEWASGAWSGWTGLVNHPHGAFGTVLSPSSAVSWALLEPIAGAARAASLTAALQLWAFSLATGWLAGVAGADRWGQVAAALSVFVGRYLIFGLGEGSIVAVAALPIPLGLGAIILTLHGERRRLAALAGAACIAWTALENPYLAPVLPGLAGLAWVRELLRARGPRGDRRRWARLTGLLVLGTLGVLGIAEIFGRSASPDYPREVAGQTVTWLGQRWDVVDLPWARATPSEWWQPGAVRWTTDATAGVSAGGGRTLGLGVWLLAGIALISRTRASLAPWGLALVGLALSVGSLLGQMAAPFLVLNGVMDAIARPLTQPTRFLILPVVGLAVCAGLGVTGLRARLGAAAGLAGPVMGGLLLAESLWIGGLSLALPTTPLAPLPCAADLKQRALDAPEEHGVLFWPWDAQDGEPGLAQLLQVRHGLPAPHRGIASWMLHEGPVIAELRTAGLANRPTPRRLKRGLLRGLGYRWLLVDTASDPKGARWVARQLRAEPEVCGELALYDLSRSAALTPDPE